MTNTLKTAEIKQLRGIAHHLEPVVAIGNHGLSAGVLEETTRALNDHELIKIKIPAGDGEARRSLCQELATQTNALLVHQIGRTAVLYKLNPDANPKLSNLARFGL